MAAARPRFGHCAAKPAGHEAKGHQFFFDVFTFMITLCVLCVLPFSFIVQRSVAARSAHQSPQAL